VLDRRASILAHGMSNFRPAVKREDLLLGDPGPSRAFRAIGGVGSLLSIQNSFRGRAQITKPYRESGWVHACLTPIGKAMAQVPLEFWTANPELDKTAEKLKPEHPLCKLFRIPNPLQTQAQFFEACAINHKLDGLTAWLLLDAAGQPIVPAASASKPTSPMQQLLQGEEIAIPSFLMPFRGRSLSYQVSEYGWPTEYQLSLWGSGSLRVSPRALHIVRSYDPDDPVGGLSDVDAALSEIDFDWQAQRYQRSIIENSGDPGGYIEVDGQLGQPEERALKREAAEAYKPEKAGQWRILTGKNVKFTANKLSPRDMEFERLLAWCRDKIAAILGVPLPVLGVLDNAHLNNFEASIRLFWLGGNGVLSLVKQFEDSINGHLLPRLKKDRDTPPTVYAKFNVGGIRALQENKAIQFEIAQKLAASGLGLSIQESLKLVGFEIEETKYSNVRLVPGSLKRLEDVLEPPADPSADPDPSDPQAGEDPDAEEPADEGEDETAGDPEKAIVARDSTPAEDEGFKARTAYWEKREVAYARAGRAEVKRKYIRWRKRYEDAQLRRLRDFARKGPDALRAVSRDMLDDILDPLHLHGSVIDPLLVDAGQWAKNMRTTLEIAIRDVFEDALLDMAEELSAAALSMDDRAVVSALETQILQLVEGHTSVLAERVRAALLEGLSKATSTGTLQDLVLEVLPELEGSLKHTFADREGRALTIARTEVGHASSAARDMQMREAGVEQTEWITSRDPAVRGTPGGPYEDAQFSHFELEGKTAPIGAEFDPANHPGLTRPHAPTAQAGDSINCRCIARPVLKET